MKFLYQYRTRDNEIRSGEIYAVDRDAAFVKLKEQGVRPAWVREAPGFFNKLVGKGKRWMAIVALTIALCVVLACLFDTLDNVKSLPQTADRGQIYGDPSFLQQCVRAGWSNVFERAGDRILARFARPGAMATLDDVAADAANKLREVVVVDVSVDADDPEPVVRVKSIVNGMRREMASYIAAGGSYSGYCDRLLQRQEQEAKLLDVKKRELEHIRLEAAGDKDEAIRKWSAINDYLRDMGFQTEEMPLEFF